MNAREIAGEACQRHALRVGEVELELLEAGRGTPLLILHGVGGNAWHPYQEKLAERYRVLAPSHPGFGRSSRPDWLDTVSDLAFFYLDLLEELELEGVHLVGHSLGGWIAAEVAVRCCHRLQSLTLVDAVGIKVGGVESRDIADVFAMTDEERLRLTWADPARAGERRSPLDPSLPEEVRTVMIRDQQTAALYTWKPFMHNPKLRHWLHRIAVPTLLVWGEADGIVRPEYGRAYADLIPGARFALLPDAGHAPQREQPAAFLETVTAFFSEVERGKGS